MNISENYTTALRKINAALDADPVFGPNLAAASGLEDLDLDDDRLLGERIFSNAQIRSILTEFPGMAEKLNPPVYLVKGGEDVFAFLNIPREGSRACC
jgi:hypothetical protein